MTSAWCRREPSSTPGCGQRWTPRAGWLLIESKERPGRKSRNDSAGRDLHRCIGAILRCTTERRPSSWPGGRGGRRRWEACPRWAACRTGPATQLRYLYRQRCTKALRNKFPFVKLLKLSPIQEFSVSSSEPGEVEQYSASQCCAVELYQDQDSRRSSSSLKSTSLCTPVRRL